MTDFLTGHLCPWNVIGLGTVVAISTPDMNRMLSASCVLEDNKCPVNRWPRLQFFSAGALRQNSMTLSQWSLQSSVKSLESQQRPDARRWVGFWYLCNCSSN